MSDPTAPVAPAMTSRITRSLGAHCSVCAPSPVSTPTIAGAVTAASMLKLRARGKALRMVPSGGRVFTKSGEHCGSVK